MAVDVLDTILRLSGVGAYLTGFRQVSTSVSEASNKQVQFHHTGVAAFAGMGAGAIALGAGLRSATRHAGEFEAKVQAFSRLFGSENVAKQMLDDLREFSGQSTFTFGGSVQFAQRLRAMGFEGKDLIKIMGTLGDAVAATGGGHDELDRVILAFGQIRTRGKLAQQEINQLSQANIPAMEILADKLNLTGDQLKDIGRHGIDSAVAMNALLAGLSERYGGQMQTFLQSMPGQIHQLKNQWEILRLEIGKPIVPGVKGVTRGLVGITSLLAERPTIGAGIGGAALAGAGVMGAMSLNAMARMSGMAMQLMGDQTGTRVSPLTGGLARGGIMGGISALFSSNPEAFKEIAQANAKKQADWDKIVADNKVADAGLMSTWKQVNEIEKQQNKEIMAVWRQQVSEYKKDQRDYNRAAKRFRETGSGTNPKLPRSLLAGEPKKPDFPWTAKPTPTPTPPPPSFDRVPPISKMAILRGAGLGAMFLGGAMGGAALISHAETQKDQGTRFWEAFAGGALTGASTGAMMGLGFGGGVGGAIGGGLVGALLGGLASGYGIGEFQSGSANKQEKYSQQQLEKLDKIHQAIVEGTEGRIMQSQILAGGDDVRRPFPQSDFARAVGEGF